MKCNRVDEHRGLRIKRTMTNEDDTYYITTPIYYVNGNPHVGTAYTMVIADSLARWNRLMGRDVFFVTGTDEHGLKISQSAFENSMTPIEWVDLMSSKFVVAWDRLDISYDRFIRTTEPAHYKTVQDFLSRIYENGYIYKDLYKGLYCVACEAYYNESELVEEGLCPVHRKAVAEISEENYFFRLSQFEQPLKAWYEMHSDAVYPPSRRNEALSFIEHGLSDISITRTSIDWGVPVPWDRDHVFYVWYDALINYLTAVDYEGKSGRFAHYWPTVHHLLGKDILRFHCVWWPAMCMAAGIEPPGNFIVHGWLLVGGEKMSKSLGNNLDPLEISHEYGVDALRYYLLRETNLGADGDFTHEGLVARYNGEIANNLGNLLQRCLALVISKLEGFTPAAPAVPPALFRFEESIQRIRRYWEESVPNLALEYTWELLRSANVYLEQSAPWKSQSSEEIASVLGAVLELIRVAAILLLPAIPSSSRLVLRRLGIEGSLENAEPEKILAWGGYDGGVKIEKQPPLFPRLEL